MSLEINWNSLRPTLGKTFKDFLNTRLEDAALPSMLRNIEILSFSLGTIPPEIQIQDITDPFPEFYEDDSDCETDEDDTAVDHELVGTTGDGAQANSRSPMSTSPAQRRRSLGAEASSVPPRGHEHSRALELDDLETASTTSGPPPYESHQTHRPMHSASGWEGMSLPFFHSQFAASNTGIVSASGLSTPRPRFLGWSNPPQAFDQARSPESRRPSMSSVRQGHNRTSSGQSEPIDKKGSPADTQLEVQLSYCGNVVVQLKVDLALNYPSAFFVTLPIEMTISEFQIDTTAVIAYIDKKVHFSLLEESDNPIKAFKITSHIGDQDKVHLTDVEKVEKFMLKEVQNMVEKELVFPSYYTFML